MIRTLEDGFFRCTFCLVFGATKAASMAGEADELVQQAVSAFKAGRKAEARSILEGVVEQNQNHEEAWLYLSGLVDSLEEQEICLENVLALNPNNQKAQQGLEAIRQKTAVQQTSPSDAAVGLGESDSAPAAGTKPPGASSSVPIGAEFEMVSGDSLFDDALDSQASYGFDSGAAPPPAADEAYDWFSGSSEPDVAPDTAPEEDPYAIPTSVDWARDDRPATYGSGQNVEMPSAQEWDSWVQGLNIAKDTPEVPEPPADSLASNASPFMTDDSAPFGETSYMVDDGDTSPTTDFSSAGESAELSGDSAYEGSSSWPSPFSGHVVSENLPAENALPSAGPFGTGSYSDEEVAPAQGAFVFDANMVESGEEMLVFDFDDDDVGGGLSSGAAGQRTASQAVRLGAEYFRLIPGEIEAKAGGIEQRSLMLIGGIVVLALLNLASFALLIL
jgi:hypothetical protein